MLSAAPFLTDFDTMNLEKLINKKFEDVRATYTKRDTMLYGLGVQACQDPLDKKDLSFVYERELQALPTMTAVLCHPGMWIADKELEVNVVKLVHAEQAIEVLKPLAVEGELIGRGRVTGVVDKGAEKGAMVYFEKALYNAANEELIARVYSTYFLRADGGCGNWGEPAAELPVVPEGEATGAIDIVTSPIAGMIYRLSGDYNPLHSDPEIATKAGFPKPILHGLCTYGVAGQSLIRAVCGYDASKLKSLGARFTKPVYPGDTLRTQYWKGEGNKVQFRVTAVERNEIVLDRGIATIG